MIDIVSNGTAQEVKNRPDHGLFIGYAPADDPEIVVYVAPNIFGGQWLPAVQGKAAQSSNFQLVSREFIGLDTKFKLRKM